MTWRRRDVLAASVGALALLAGCAPRLQPPGPGLRPGGPPPRLDGDGHAVMRDGLRLPLRRWTRGAGDPAVVLIALHGFNDYGHAFAEAGPFLANRGIAVWAPDQRGFGDTPHRGLWAGTARLTNDLRDLVALARQTYPRARVLVLGESMGGAVVLATLGAPVDPARVDGAVLVAPAVWGAEGRPLLARLLMPLVSHAIPWMTFTGEGLDIWPSDNRDWLLHLSRDPLTLKETRVDAVAGLFDLMDAAHAALPRVAAPVLVMLGENDHLVPIDATLPAMRALVGEGRDPLRRPALYRDGWHMLLRDLSGVLALEDIIAWVRDPRAPLPSGADTQARALLAGDLTLSPRETPAWPAY
ncbi:alpha/beta fold hydrolase [Roseospira visakhapatnamensis]|uniref:Alpha-beta hydrolase superfamily lysophospholipase n=1 Tax=Roseospira visakhapatnamensis TaxID=390880 RepID=A0A7W6W804_9PROT|nr:alpha/beta fold hydrolase [Roseospira visakhapatnamensis]MBB4264470.1 alpha-beta hydrolase superfamily lysophospholipase [Roseospira visakhapatnamensis]